MKDTQESLGTLCGRGSVLDNPERCKTITLFDREVRLIGAVSKTAKEVLAKKKAEASDGRYVSSAKKPSPLLEEIADEYLKYYRANRKPRSVERHKMAYKALSRELAGKRLSNITPLVIERYKQMRKEQGRSEVTINRKPAFLKNLFTMAIQWGRAHENPVKRIQMFREDNGRTRFLTDEEEVRLLSECDAHLRPVVIAAIHTGFWKSELLFLTWGNVDFQHQLITVEAGYAKNGEARSIPMTSRLTDTLKPIRIHGDSNQRVSEQRGETLPRPPQLRSTRQSSGRGSRFLHFMTCVIRLPLASSRVALT